MKQDITTYMNENGLPFFGKINASISHELKNILAIISETAGFLNDLTALAKQGQSLDLSLLEKCNDSIAEEIQRGFKTVNQMNRFAHSVDIPVTQTDAGEMLRLAVSLSGFLSYSTKAELNMPEDKTYPVTASPFLLLSIFYQSLTFIYQTTGSGGQVDIQILTPEEDRFDVVFSFQGIGEWDGSLPEAIIELMTVIEAKHIVNSGKGTGQLTVSCPVEI